MDLTFKLWCPRCGFRGSAGEYHPWCPRCRGPLEGEDLPPPRPILGEGGTPLVEFHSGAYAKLEYLNPSGSFKDRGVGYSLWIARRLGYKCAVVDSSGNTGLSTAVYSAYLGLEARIYVPASAAPGKKSLIRAVGARLIETRTRDEARIMAEREADECFHIAHPTSALFLEGMKTAGTELAGHAEGADIFVPTSSGSLLIGINRGLREAGVGGYRLIAVQSKNAYSLKGRVPELASIGGDQASLLDALLLRNPARLEELARAVLETGGGVVAVGNEAAVAGFREAHAKGLLAEPSSAAALAAFLSLKEKLEARRAILVLTGSSLKYVGLIENIISRRKL